ncbi:MAG: orotate phosphoribosyltransferase, partial [Candidatus Cloacimonetes bacterium]|nr:orotate phosphoribosyltransferase [Candidatus Cloacimonadota bacterium]
MITIAKFENFFEAELASSLLLENGIATELLNVRMLSMAPGLAGQRLQIELQVPASQKEMALLILNIQDSINPAEELLRAEGAILEGHFQLTSGRHSGMYVEKIRLLQNPSAAKELCAQLATLLADYDIDCVVGPAYGGIALAFEVASLLGKSFVFCQRKDGQMTIRSGFDLNGVKRVAIVEDIVTTGGSVEEVMACLSQGISSSKPQSAWGGCLNLMVKPAGAWKNLRSLAPRMASSAVVKCRSRVMAWFQEWGLYRCCPALQGANPGHTGGIDPVPRRG